MRRLLLLASAVVLVDTAFYAAITPLLPAFSRDLGLTKAAAGVLAAAYPVGTLLGSLPGGWLATRAGVRATVLLGLGLMTAASVAFAFAGSIAMLDVARFVQGFGGACSWAGAFGWLIGAAPRERRGELIGAAMGAAIGGALLGPVLGALADAVGTAVVFCSVAAAGLALMAWAACMPAARPERGASLATLGAALRDRRVVTGMWLVTMPGLLFGTIAVLAPLRMADLGAGAATIAAAFLAGAALEAALSPLVGRWTDRRGRMVPALAGLAGAAVVMAALPWPRALWGAVTLVVLAAPVIGLLWAPAMAMLSDGAEGVGLPQAPAFALMNLAWGVGQSSGNAGGGWLAQAAGDAVPYLLLSALAALTGAVLSARSPGRSPATRGPQHEPAARPRA